MIEQEILSQTPIESLSERVEIGESLLHDLFKALQEDPQMGDVYEEILAIFDTPDPNVELNLHSQLTATSGIKLIGRIVMSKTTAYESLRVSFHEAESTTYRSIGISFDEGKSGIFGMSFQAGRLSDSYEAADEFRRNLSDFFKPPVSASSI